MPTAFLQCHWSVGWRGAQIALLYSISSYVPRMEMHPSPWDDLSFASKVEVTWGSIGCANWLPISLHYIFAAIYVLIAQAVDASLSVDPKMDLLGPFVAYYAGIDSICIRKIIYLPAPCVGIFLERDLTPA